MDRNPITWLGWAVCLAGIALMVENPLYLCILLLVVVLTHLTMAPPDVTASGWWSLLKLGGLVWLVTIPFNALMIHQGEHVLWRFPSSWPLIGGPITLEAVLVGLSSGLALWLVLLIFTTFNATIDATRLISLTPAFLYQVGVVVAIALTFVPQMIKSAREIREAQRIRGHQFRGWRDVTPLVLPLLTSALERAIDLAESMAARGFGGQMNTLAPRRRNWMRGGALFGLLLLLAGFVLRSLLPSYRSLAWPMLIAGILALGWVFYTLGQEMGRTRYHRLTWSRLDIVTIASCAGMTLLIWLLGHQEISYLNYTPFADQGLAPGFAWWMGSLLALLGLLPLAWLFQKSPTPSQTAFARRGKAL